MHAGDNYASNFNVKRKRSSSDRGICRRLRLRQQLRHNRRNSNYNYDNDRRNNSDVDSGKEAGADRRR